MSPASSSGEQSPGQLVTLATSQCPIVPYYPVLTRARTETFPSPCSQDCSPCTFFGRPVAARPPASNHTGNTELHSGCRMPTRLVQCLYGERRRRTFGSQFHRPPHQTWLQRFWTPGERLRSRARVGEIVPTAEDLAELVVVLTSGKEAILRGGQL